MNPSFKLCTIKENQDLKSKLAKKRFNERQWHLIWMYQNQMCTWQALLFSFRLNCIVLQAHLYPILKPNQWFWSPPPPAILVAAGPYWWTLRNNTSVKFKLKYKTFHSRKCVWKCRLRNVQGRWVNYWRQTIHSLISLVSSLLWTISILNHRERRPCFVDIVYSGKLALKKASRYWDNKILKKACFKGNI